MKKTRVLLAEDHLVVRNGIKLLLDSQDNLEVVGDVASGKEILDLVASGVEADILITDLTMDNMGGIELIRELNKQDLGIQAIVLTMLEDERSLVEAFQAGAKAYLIKNVPIEEMIFCIDRVVHGRNFLCGDLTMKLINQLIERTNGMPFQMDPSELDLTERELEVLNLIGEGLTNLEISKKLFLSKRTVEGHRQNLIDKTKSKNTPALIKFAVQNGLVQ